MAKSDKYRQPRQVVGATTINDNEPSAEETLKGVEKWYTDRSGLINKVLIGILAVVAAYLAYTKFYKQPAIAKANDAIFRAQTYFGMDSINWALNGDGNNAGFLKIIKNYGGTPAGNLAHYYAGVCYLKMGDFKNAEKQLKDFDGKGTVVEDLANGLLGDAYMEQGKTEDAIKQYLSASKDDKNMFLAPMYMERAALAYEKKNNNEEAKKLYRKLKDIFPMSMQARTVDKSLARLGDLNP
ncbi:MAG: tetratricopeptide repeat protein [Chitinophagaceae bacterium]